MGREYGMEWAQNKGSRSARSALKAVSRGRNAVKIYGLFFESVRHGPQAACTELCICETAPDVSCQRRRGLCIVSSLFGGRGSGSYIRRVRAGCRMVDSQFSSDANGGYCRRHDGDSCGPFADVGARHCDTHAYSGCSALCARSPG